MLSIKVHPTVIRSADGEATAGLIVQVEFILPVTQADELMTYMKQAGTQAILSTNWERENSPTASQITGQEMATAHEEAEEAKTEFISQE